MQSAHQRSAIRLRNPAFCVWGGAASGSLPPLLSRDLSHQGQSCLLAHLASCTPSPLVVTGWRRGGSSIPWITIWGAFIDIWGPEITDGGKISCSLIWQNAFELWCWRKLFESPLDCKEIQPVHPKGYQPWCSLEGMVLKLKLQYFGHLM